MEITGKYIGTVRINESKNEEDFEILLKSKINKIVSLEFHYMNSLVKLTGVLQNDRDFISLYVADKFFDDYYINGIGMESIRKNGVHGIINVKNKTLQIHLNLNQFNKKSISLIFNGSLKYDEFT